jgi:FlaA1/EpsC-like NDP-sugar epimerase
LSNSAQQSHHRSYFTKVATVFGDAALIAAALGGAYLIRFDFLIWQEYQAQLVRLLPIVIMVRLSALYHTGGYRTLWKYTSLSDVIRLFQGVVVGSVLLVVINYFRNYPLGVAIALVFLASAVGYRSMLVRRSSGRSLAVGIAVMSVAVLSVGLVAFTILRSAPVTLASVPVLQALVAQDFQSSLSMPRAVVVLEGILAFLLVGGARVAPRLVREVYSRRRRRGRRVLVFGAGDVGENLVRAMLNHQEFGFQPVGFIDDDPAKQRVSIHSVAVLGDRKDLLSVIQQLAVEELLITISELPTIDLREIAAVCRSQGVAVRRVPGLSLLLDGQTGLQHLEEVDIESLLGRSEVELDPERIVGYLQDRVVLVTGAGGSIGSELCRQIGRCAPIKLLLLGKGENSIYQIQQELSSRYPELQTVCLIADIGNQAKMDSVFRHHRPEVVFHAAAHKHVPFMEDHPEEAVRNNVFGTRSVAMAAVAHQAKRFVMVSSDKAVSPSSVMGTTKRIAELIVQQLASSSATQFVTVRFGNVLRSRGSVLPLFERQIRDGGPVTVTHPDMTRYFMSIPEAVRLVLHSGTVGSSGDLCILDMGQPVRIATLAENMIRMAGKRPFEEIAIVYTGIRPGEKLAEELFSEAEARALRKVDKILICRPECRESDKFDDQLGRLRQAAEACLHEDVLALMREIVPDYHAVSAADGMAAVED